MKNLAKFFSIISIIGFMPCVSAVPLLTVGAMDDLVASADLSNSSLAGEKAWIETYLGFEVEYSKLGASSSGEGAGSGWVEVEGGNPDDYAFDFGTLTPDYYLIKTGNLHSTDNTHFLFKNSNALNWAYINLQLTEDTVFANIGKISHVGVTGGGSSVDVPVPEPGSLVLLALGLIGLVASRRRI